MKMAVQSVKTVVKVEAVRDNLWQSNENLELMDAKGEGIYQRIKNQPHFEVGLYSKERLDEWIKDLLDCKPTAKSRLRMFSLRRKHFWKRVNRRKNGYRK